MLVGNVWREHEWGSQSGWPPCLLVCVPFCPSRCLSFPCIAEPIPTLPCLVKVCSAPIESCPERLLLPCSFTFSAALCSNCPFSTDQLVSTSPTYCKHSSSYNCHFIIVGLLGQYNWCSGSRAKDGQILVSVCPPRQACAFIQEW